MKKNKQFETPMGHFVYDYVTPSYYHVAIERILIDNKRSFLMATKEKALYDRILKESIKTPDDMEKFLIDGLRIDPYSLKELDLRRILEIGSFCKRKISPFFIECIRRFH